jgi:hypothetical protein
MPRPVPFPLALALALASAAVATPAAAQPLPLEVELSGGVSAPSDRYTNACGHTHATLGLRGRTRGDAWAEFGIRGYSAGGGSDIRCEGVEIRDTMIIARSGGLDLARALRVGAGAGRSAAFGPLGVEAGALAGVIRGRPGLEDSREEGGAPRWLPWAGGAGALTVAGRLSVSGEVTWTRLPHRERHIRRPPMPTILRNLEPAAPARLSVPAEADRVVDGAEWSPLAEFRLGVRL